MHKLSNDLWRRVSKAIEHPFIDKRTDKSLLIALHGEAFSSSLCKTCENEQILAYIELTRLIKPKEMKTPPSKKYRFSPLHEDKSVSLKGYRGVITADTLTDQVAKLMLKSGNYEGFIVTVEQAESIREEMSKPIPEYSKMKVSELKALLDEKEIEYGDAKKSELIELATVNL